MTSPLLKFLFGEALLHFSSKDTDAYFAQLEHGLDRLPKNRIVINNGQRCALVSEDKGAKLCFDVKGRKLLLLTKESAQILDPFLLSEAEQRAIINVANELNSLGAEAKANIELKTKQEQRQKQKQEPSILCRLAGRFLHRNEQDKFVEHENLKVERIAKVRKHEAAVSSEGDSFIHELQPVDKWQEDQ